MAAPSKPIARASIDDVAINAVLIAVRQAANVICDRWSLIALLHAHAGTYRFSDFRDRCGVANRQLMGRLKTLEEQEILVRLPYTRRPLRYGYHLTHMGLELFEFFVAMLRWEHRWHPQNGAAAVSLMHVACGAPSIDPWLHCAHCGEVLTARNVGRLKVDQQGLERMPDKLMAFRRSTDSLARLGTDEKAPLGHCIEIFGDKWSIELIVSAFLRVGTFGGFQAHTGISTNILSDRLMRLVSLGILRQTTSEEPGRTGTYALTEKGIDLYPVLLAIQAWADDWVHDRYRSPLRLQHRTCRTALRLVTRCGDCGAPVTRSDAQLKIG